MTSERSLSAFTDAAIVPIVEADDRRALLDDPDWWRPDRPVRLALAVDYGEDVGHAVWLLFAFQTIGRTSYGPRVRIRVIGEWTNPKRLGVLEEAAEVAKMVVASGVRMRDIDFAVGDINSAGKSHTGARSLNEEFEAAFARIMRKPRPTFEFRPATKGADSIDIGLIRTNRLLADGDLEMYEACEAVTEACRHWTGKNDDLKHRIDALRYGVTAILAEEGVEPTRLAA
jgi:hypothetical protein